MSKRPNLLIFNPDQWRGDVMGHLGNAAAQTPHLDRLVAEDGVSFRNAFCQNPVCTPSRCSFMTGWYPHVRGHRTMFHMLQQDEPMLLKRLKDAGYFVWWGGKNDVVPAENGFADYCDSKYQPPPSQPPAERTAGGSTATPGVPPDAQWRGDLGSDTYYAFMKGRLEAPEGAQYSDGDWGNVRGAIDLIHKGPQDRPLCIYLPLGFPHPPYGVEEPWFSAIERTQLPPRTPAPVTWEGKPSILQGIYERQRMQGWSEERWQELRATYYGMCARVDHQFGMVLQALREMGMYDDTAVFFFSDHGDFTGDYGLVEKTQNTFEDCLTRVPFVVKPPAWTAVLPGVRDELVELVDLVATVEDWTGLERDYTHFGSSLGPLAAGKSAGARAAVFCEGGRLHGETHCMELEAVDQQIPSGLYWPRLSLQRSEGPEHSKATMCRTQEYKYVRRLYEQDELYDLKNDPRETYNRIDDPALQAVLAEMKERLLTFYQATCDVTPHVANRR